MSSTLGISVSNELGNAQHFSTPPTQLSLVGVIANPPGIRSSFQLFTVSSNQTV